jgi:hypothetical protein
MNSPQNHNIITKHLFQFNQQRKTSATIKDSKNNSDSLSEKKRASQSGRIGSILKSQGVKRSRVGVNTGPMAKIAVGKGVRHQLNGYLRNPVIPNTAQSMGAYEQQQQDTDPTSLAKSAVGKGITHQYARNNTGVSDVTSSTANAMRGNNLDGFKQHGTNGNFTFLDPSQLGMGIDNSQNSLSELQSNYQSSLNESDQTNGTGNGGITTSKSSLRRDSSLVALAMIPSLQSIEPTPVYELEAVDDKAMMTFIDFPNTGEQLGLDLES